MRFTRVSFYRSIILLEQLCKSFCIIFECIILRLNFKNLQHHVSFYRFTLVTLVLTKSPFFLTKPADGHYNTLQYCTTSIKFLSSNQNLHVHIFLSRERLKYHQPTLWTYLLGTVLRCVFQMVEVEPLCNLSLTSL